MNPMRFSFLPILALLLATISCGGGSASTSTAPKLTPSVTGFSPQTGAVGTTVTVNGSNLTGATVVQFANTAATFSPASSTQLTAVVPTGANTGKVSVVTPNGTGISPASFTVTSTAPAPTISGFAPTSAQTGATIIVSGTDLTGTTGVAFNGSAATFSVLSNTQISATVPSSATTGRITATTPTGTATSGTNFTVTAPAAPPVINGFSPASGQSGTSVTITGGNLTGATEVSFNGAASTFSVNTATQITATVPGGAATGKISVTTPGGTTSSAANFTVSASASGLDLTIDGLYVTQATQDYPTASVPLVQNRSAWVRVFVRANQSNTVAPQVRVQFTNGSTSNTLNINAPAASVPTTVDPNTDTAWNAAVSASWIQPGVQLSAQVDPTNAVTESDETNNQFSETLDVRSIQPWKVTLIPVHTGDGRTGVVENTSRTKNDFIDFAKRLHPVADAVDVQVGATLNSAQNSLSADGTGWSQVLSEIGAKRSTDGVADRYYYGVVKVNYTSGVAGLGYVGFPAAIGWDYSSAPSVFAHEEGHNFGRQHSPCGGASGPDPNYPYAGGIIGVPGWDAFASSGNLKSSSAPPQGYTDIMGYCSKQWISDYVYLSELNYRQSHPSASIMPDVVSGSDQQEGLLVWGRIENGQTILEPTFRVPVNGAAPEPGPYVWEAQNAVGQVLASVPFDAPEVADLPHTSLRMFSFIVPMTSEAMNTVQSVRMTREGTELARASQTGTFAFGAPAMTRMSNRRAQFTWNAARYPVIMLRDARTHEVRGFLRGGNAIVQDAPDDIDVQYSDGVRSQGLSFRQVGH